MTYTNVFKRSIGTAALTGTLLVTSAMAQAPYGAPTPDQYAAQNPQYAAPATMNNDPNGGQYGQNGAPQDPNGGQYGPPQQGMDQQQGPPQQGMPQNGAPQGIQQAPPPIPDYEQPPAPSDGAIWTPGYWAWSGDGYEWVNGSWVAAPYTNALWTPGYWGYADDGYFWNAGYWGPTVGYYGGINYGFGYFGIGFYGGYWGGGRFFYNRAYCNIGYGRGFNVYSRSYAGFGGRPGGASFVHANGFGGRGAAGFRGAAGMNRGSAINGNVRASGFAQGNNRAASGAGNYNGAARGATQAPAQSHGNYGGGSNGGGSHTAPSGGAAGGGGFHGGGGGGGGSHGGGGGHR
jgi:hypothetical protein